MKVRADFVTNSSSTSYVVIARREFGRSDFLRLVGVNDESPLAPVFEHLYQRMARHMRSPEEYFGVYRSKFASLRALLEEEFSADVADRVAKAMQEGKKVYLGELSSEDDLVECFFCTDSFELENEEIYLNALDCTW